LSVGRCLLKLRKTLGCGAIAVNSVVVLVDVLGTLGVEDEAGERVWSGGLCRSAGALLREISSSCTSKFEPHLSFTVIGVKV
jgi:hypothetical protein